MDTRTRPVRVLIVDDQAPFRSAARMVVDLADGFTVAGEADSGVAAIQRMRDVAPDLVLMDVKMPGLDGIEATRRILDDYPHTRVVILSTYDEYRDRAVRSGASAFIAKSEFTPDVLAATWIEATC